MDVHRIKKKIRILELNVSTPSQKSSNTLTVCGAYFDAVFELWCSTAPSLITLHKT